jgi:hypothetical protein
MVERQPSEPQPDTDGDARHWSRTIRCGGQEVILHYDDLPDCDVTVVDGIPCTTALRTVIDLAPELNREDLDRVVGDCLRRGLFTIGEAHERLSCGDMRARPGAALLRRSLERYS